MDTHFNPKEGVVLSKTYTATLIFGQSRGRLVRSRQPSSRAGRFFVWRLVTRPTCTIPATIFSRYSGSYRRSAVIKCKPIVLLKNELGCGATDACGAGAVLRQNLVPGHQTLDQPAKRSARPLATAQRRAGHQAMSFSRRGPRPKEQRGEDAGTPGCCSGLLGSPSQ